VKIRWSGYPGPDPLRKTFYVHARRPARLVEGFADEGGAELLSDGSLGILSVPWD